MRVHGLKEKSFSCTGEFARRLLNVPLAKSVQCYVRRTLNKGIRLLQIRGVIIWRIPVLKVCIYTGLRSFQNLKLSNKIVTAGAASALHRSPVMQSGPSQRLRSPRQSPKPGHLDIPYSIAFADERRSREKFGQKQVQPPATA